MQTSDSELKQSEDISWFCRLYTVEGQLIRGPDDLQHKQNYVAVGAERFKPLPYERCIPCNDNIRGNNILGEYEAFYFSIYIFWSLL